MTFRLTLLFALLALVCGLFGFGRLQGGLASIAKFFLFLFLVLSIFSLVFGRRR